MKSKLLSLLLFFAVAVGYAQVSSVAIVGGSVGGWGTDGVPDTHQMTSTDNVNWTYTIEILSTPVGDPGLKFRANNAWTINWGSSSFPTGVAAQNGPNIMGVPGIYDVTFNSETGAFHFDGAPIPVVKITGSATSEDIVMSTVDGSNFTVSDVTLLAGGAMFNIDGNVAYGGTTFPGGTAESEGVEIPVPAGRYTTVTYSLDNGNYMFTAAPTFPSIALVGSGAGGWPNDPQVDANALTTTDGINYTGTVTLTAVDPTVTGSGEIKFRQDNAWGTSWGGGSFPTGPTDAAQNIFVTTAGTYDVTFNIETGAYTFSIPTFAIVGAGAGGWPNDPQVDTNVMTTTDGATYTLASITLTTGEIKFRANNGWALNFGGTEFPSGTAVFNSSDNIPAVAGTYGVTLNRVTGAYTFGPELSATSFDKSAFKAYPNPTTSKWNFDSAKENIETIQIVDMLGKTVLNITPKATSASVDASALNSGVYFARIATATGTKTVKVIKN